MAKTAAQRQREQRERTAAKIEVFEFFERRRKNRIEWAARSIIGPRGLVEPVATALAAHPHCQVVPLEIAHQNGAIYITWPDKGELTGSIVVAHHVLSRRGAEVIHCPGDTRGFANMVIEDYGPDVAEKLPVWLAIHATERKKA